MSDNAIGLIVLACIFGASLLGMLMRPALSQHHLSADTKDSVKLGMGLVGTMAALILGLLVAAAKSAYDTEKNEVTQMAAKLVFLDRVLASSSRASRSRRIPVSLLRRLVEDSLNRIVAGRKVPPCATGPTRNPVTEDSAQSHLRSCRRVTMCSSPLKIPSHRDSSATSGQIRSLFRLSSQAVRSPYLSLIVMISSLYHLLSWASFAPSNSIAIYSLLFAALSVSGAIFLILELYQPFDGLIHISSESMRNALSHLRK